MTDLDAMVAARLDEQPPVRTPPFDQIRRQSRSRARRRHALSGLCLLVLSATAVMAAQATVGDDGGRPDRLAGPARDPLVRAGAAAVEACPADPKFPSGLLCGSTDDSELISEITGLVNALPTGPAEARGCRPEDEDAGWLVLRFSYADGDGAAFRVDDCILTGPSSMDRPAVYAADVVRAAARLFRPAPPRSTKQGCAAVIEDTESLLAQSAQRARQSDIAYAVSIAELAIAEQRERLTPAQRAIAEDLGPALDSYLYDKPDSEGLRTGLEQLQASCPG